MGFALKGTRLIASRNETQLQVPHFGFHCRCKKGTVENHPNRTDPSPASKSELKGNVCRASSNSWLNLTVELVSLEGQKRKQKACQLLGHTAKLKIRRSIWFRHPLISSGEPS